MNKLSVPKFIQDSRKQTDTLMCELPVGQKAQTARTYLGLSDASPNLGRKREVLNVDASR